MSKVNLFSTATQSGSIQFIGKPGENVLDISNDSIDSVSGNFPIFIDDTGGFGDSGISPSDPTKTKAVMTNGSTVVGDVALFSDTSGTIQSSGITPSNAAKNKMVMANGATIVGQLATFSDTSGTVQSSGIVPSNPSKTNAVMANGATVIDEIATFSDTSGTVKTSGTKISDLLSAGQIYTLTGAGGSASNNVILTNINPLSSVLILSQVSSANSQPLLGYSLPSPNTITLVWASNPGAFVVNAIVKF